MDQELSLGEHHRICHIEVKIVHSHKKLFVITMVGNKPIKCSPSNSIVFHLFKKYEMIYGIKSLL